jgi:excisionase family DNA binding protein
LEEVSAMSNEVKTEGERLLYRVAEVANMIGVSRAYLYVLINEGKVPVVRLGPNAVRIPREALAKWVQENTVQEAA